MRDAALVCATALGRTLSVSLRLCAFVLFLVAAFVRASAAR
jgi:hypothetical protein